MKKALSLVLAVVLVFALVAGCAESGSTTTTPAPSTAAPSTGDSGSTGTTDNTGDEGTAGDEVVDGVVTDDGFVHSYTPIEWGDNPISDVGQKTLDFDMVADSKNLPLVADKATLTAWWPMDAGTYITEMNEAANHQELENRTNVHIEYFHPSIAEVGTSFPLMIASDDYADMIYYAENYIGGGDKAIEDEVYIRLNELIDEYAPNYKALREYADQAQKMTITSKGNIWGFYSLCFEAMPGYMGLNIRKDFMDTVGITERPATIDEWDQTLGTMMSALGTEYAIGIPPTGITRYSAFLSAYGIGGEWYQIDGVAKYGPVEPEFRTYVELMKSWYEKGYLRSDFYSVVSANYNEEITWRDYANGKMVACDGSNTFGSMLTMWGDDPNAYGLAVRQPVLNAGDETHIRFDQGYVNGQQLAISTSCENPELAVSWMDYRYTEDGFMLLHYGIEGLTYKYIGDHEIRITDNIINNDEGANPMTYVGKYSAGGLSVSLSDYTVNWCYIDPVYAVEILVWGQDKCDHNYPNIEMPTAEMGSEFAKLYSDIETYIHETVPKFIIGSLSMDKYDDFVAQIYALGMDRCIELKQAALDDFNSRG